MEESSMLTEHQKVLLELWHVFDRICKEHNIPYMLFAGSALGAVRNQGIIPWDDDLDVVMLRPDYERFLAIVPGVLSEQYYLQSEFSAHWPMFFSKLRKNGTACIERYHPKDPETHQGIYIDIFPCDNLYNDKIKRGMQFLVSKAVIAQSIDRRGYLTNNLLKKLFMALCRKLPREKMLDFVQARNTTDSACVHTFFGGAKSYQKNIYPREWFMQKLCVPFEDGYAPASKHYDKLLTKLYGDYMTPLPEDQRKYKIHAHIVDTERNYTEYLNLQSNTQYDVYTRSIR